MLSDPGNIGNLPPDAQAGLFDPDFWQARGELRSVTGGRGSAWFVGPGAGRWVLRHFRRGGFIARCSQDAYLWMGESKVRAFAEWELLEILTQRGLRVPKPVAARYEKRGLLYRCDLITERIADAEPLSAALDRAELAEPQWRAIGAAVRSLHREGVDHADLNAHNLLLTSGNLISVIDFDRGRLRAPGAWSSRNLRRLHRSLTKIASGLPPGRFPAAAWAWLLAGYAAR